MIGNGMPISQSRPPFNMSDLQIVGGTTYA
jgi:hypothetical protein